jgi:hypothetical protein
MLPIATEFQILQLHAEVTMTPSLHSQSFKSTPSLELHPAVREVIAAMPIVIFAKAIRDAFFRPAKPALAAARTSRAR